MVEAGVNIKVIQDALGHKDIQTTMNIYADVTQEFRKSEFDGLDGYFRKSRRAYKKEAAAKDKAGDTAKNQAEDADNNSSGEKDPN